MEGESHESLEPGVIDEDEIKIAIEEQGPKGEAGRLAAREGIAYNEVFSLRLEFKNLLKIDNLWMMTSLTKLQLDNNIIEKIENIHMLVNLKELDLSFNNIELIENINDLVHLEILTLFENRISKIENMDSLKKLMIFSIGNNKIEDWSNIIYLRKFPELRSLNLAGNECCEKEGFLTYLYAHLPQLKYYEYKLIKHEDKQAASAVYVNSLEHLIEAENTEAMENQKKAARDAEIKYHTEAFVEELDKDQLFEEMFLNDYDGRVLLQIESVKDFYNNFKENFVQYTKEIFRFGIVQHGVRKLEFDQFSECAEDAKAKNMEMSRVLIDEYFVDKTKIFTKLRNELENMETLEEDETPSDEQMSAIQAITDTFQDKLQDMWTRLMEHEILLFDQLEDTMGLFSRNLTDMVGVCKEAVQAQFVQCRNAETIYQEAVAEAAFRFAETIKPDDDQSEKSELKELLPDKDAVNNALGASHDVHLQVIDGREDIFMNRINTWLETFLDKIRRDEIQRNRASVMEINNFLDIQREEFDDLQRVNVPLF